jgi:hypothetical protein
LKFCRGGDRNLKDKVLKGGDVSRHGGKMRVDTFNGSMATVY